MNKKGVLILGILGVVIISIFFASFVSAATDPWTAISDIFKPIIQLLVGSGETNLFERFLFALVIFAVVYAVLDRVPLFNENGFALFAVAISLAVLGARFIADTDLVQTIIFSNGVFAVALLSILPFVVYFYFVYKGLEDSRILRRFAWVVYIIVFLGMYTVKSSSGADYTKYAWMYVASALLALLSLIIDGTIKGMLTKMKIEKATMTYKGSGALAIQSKMAEITNLWKTSQTAYVGGLVFTGSHGKTGTEAYNSDMEHLEKEFHKA